VEDMHLLRFTGLALKVAVLAPVSEQRRGTGWLALPAAAQLCRNHPYAPGDFRFTMQTIEFSALGS
jgi:hypothetical protein